MFSRLFILVRVECAGMLSREIVCNNAVLIKNRKTPFSQREF